jgi:hypothetical protein
MALVPATVMLTMQARPRAQVWTAKARRLVMRWTQALNLT